MLPLDECKKRMEGHNVALCISGGKDSMATLHHLWPLLDRVTVYWSNPGDPDPYTTAMMAMVAESVPKFVEVRGDVLADRAEFGHPSDVVPVSMTKMMAIGMKDKPALLVRLTMDCCHKNQMVPLYLRLIEDGVTMIIRGQKSKDEYINTHVSDGSVIEGMTFMHPLEDETDESVIAYLKEHQPNFLHRWYEDDLSKGSIDCLSCTGWWDEIGEGYLQTYYPEVFKFRRAVRAAVKEETLAVLKWVC